MYTIVMLLLTAACFALFGDLSYSYITDGYGLHPAVAGSACLVAATICAVAIYFHNRGNGNE